MNLYYTAETKFLGIHKTETLKWNSHVQSLASKLSKLTFTIKSLKEILSSIHFNLFGIRLIYRGCDQSDMELVKYDLNHLFYKISITFMVWYITLGGIGKWMKYVNTKMSDKINGRSKLKNIL